MNKNKKTINLNGSLLAPLAIGEAACIRTGGKFLRTARVVAIHEQSEDCIRFETRKYNYHLTMPVLPPAADKLLYAELAACA